MEFEMKPYIVYVKTSSGGYITAVNSSAFLSDTTEWVEIDRGYGDKYHHAQGNYFPNPIRTDGGACRYKLDGGIAVECTEEEIVKQEAALVVPERPSEDAKVAELEKQVAELQEQLAATKILLGVE